MAKITWAGQACFQISLSNSPARHSLGAGGKDSQSNVVIDPFGEIGLKMPGFQGDVVLVTHDHEDHNNIKAVKGDCFWVAGPGEYEIKGIFVKGIAAFHDNENGKERGKNTIYTIEGEGIKFCHLGDLGQHQLTDEQLDSIGHVDILMIPVGGEYTIDAQKAPKIIGQIDPKIVIPMHYALPKLKYKLDSVEKFLKAMGKNSLEAQDKLIVKISSLPKEGTTEVILLKP